MHRGIAPESADQTIDFGQISKAHLNAKGTSVKKDVNIKLVNCELGAAQKTVQVTFKGNTVDGAKKCWGLQILAQGL